MTFHLIPSPRQAPVAIMPPGRCVTSLTVLLLATVTTAVAIICPHPPPTSCSNAATSSNVDPCCVPSPGGIVLFTQRFEPDIGDDGRWGVDGIDLWEWVGNTHDTSLNATN